MGLLDGLEKLITEHGSASIIKERLALAEDQYKALERKASENGAELIGLKQENKRLQEENRQLKAQLAAFQPKTSSRDLPPEAETMLQRFASDSTGLQLEEAVHGLGLTTAKQQYLFDQLKKRDFVEWGGVAFGMPIVFFATAEGREYLHKAGLL